MKDRDNAIVIAFYTILITLVFVIGNLVIAYNSPIQNVDFSKLDKEYHLRLSQTSLLLSQRRRFSFNNGYDTYYIGRGNLNERFSHVRIEVFHSNPYFPLLENNRYHLIEERTVSVDEMDVCFRLYSAVNEILERAYDLLFYNGFGYIRIFVFNLTSLSAEPDRITETDINNINNIICNVLEQE